MCITWHYHVRARQNCRESGGFAQMLCVTRQEPAEIRKPIEIAENLGVQLRIFRHQSGHPALSPATSGSGHVECRSGESFARSRPVFELGQTVCFKVVNYSCEAVGHRGGGKRK